MRKLAVSEYMTPNVATVDRMTTIDAAARIMRKQGIHHLPVVTGERLVGIASDRDLTIVGTHGRPDGGSLPVHRVMTEVPFCVPPTAPLSDVVEVMAGRGHGSAIVVDERGGVVGIFTTADACRAFAAMLREDETCRAAGA